MNNNLKKLILITMATLFSSGIFADTASDYQKAQDYIKSSNLNGQLSSSISEKNINIPVDHNPDQKKYYQNPAIISSDAISNISVAGSLGNNVDKNTLNAPKYTVNLNSPEIQTAQLIHNNAASIVTGTYKDCDKKDYTKVIYTNKICQTSVPLNFPCTRILNVSIDKQYNDVNQNENLANRVTLSGSSAAIHLDTAEGKITAFSMHARDASDPWSCFKTYYLNINGNRVAQYHGSCGYRLGDLQFDANNLAINFSQNSFQISLDSGSLSGTFSGNLTLTVKQEKDVATDTWDSSCPAMPAVCQIQSECLEPNETKTISDVPVTRACWKYQDNYQCGSDTASSCITLHNKGCTQTSSQCIQKVSGMCSLYSENWSCPDKQVIGKGISCGKKFYCMDGSCQQTTDDKNKDFGKSVTQLAAATSAGSDVQNQHLNSNFDPNAIKMFTGQEAECRKLPLDIGDCCADTGWGNGILVHCTDQEKHLGQSKESGLVVETGEYCHNKIAGFCTQHRKTYCIFPSKLALDVQLHGRQEQLGRSFGSGDHTDCSGISPSEMQQIDFSKIDFTNVAGDIVNQKSLPNSQSMKQYISNHITDKSNAPKPSPYSKGGL